MTAFKGILFDNDGTLVDTHDLILSSMRYSTQHVLGCVLPDEVLMRKVGQPLAVQVRDFTDDLDLQQEWLRVYREHNHSVHDDMVVAFPGVIDGLRVLSDAGVSLGVVTSKMHWLAWRGLEIVDAAPYLQCCVGADDCNRFKPDPDPVLMGCELLGLSPDECLYVGDSPYDLQAGTAAGCATAAATWGMFSADELRACNPTYEYSTFSDLVVAQMA